MIWTDFPHLTAVYCVYLSIDTWRLSLLWFCRTKCEGSGLSCVREKLGGYGQICLTVLWLYLKRTAATCRH